MEQYFPIVDLVTPEGEEWTVDGTGVASGYAKKTQPRKGGGSLLVAAGEDDLERIDRIRALLDIRYGHKSKVGNIAAPLSLFDTIEAARLDAIAVRDEVYQDQLLAMVLDTPKRIAARAFATALRADNRINILGLLDALLPTWILRSVMVETPLDDAFVHEVHAAFVMMLWTTLDLKFTIEAAEIVKKELLDDLWYAFLAAKKRLESGALRRRSKRELTDPNWSTDLAEYLFVRLQNMGSLAKKELDKKGLGDLLPGSSDRDGDPSDSKGKSQSGSGLGFRLELGDSASDGGAADARWGRDATHDPTAPGMSMSSLSPYLRVSGRLQWAAPTDETPEQYEGFMREVVDAAERMRVESRGWGDTTKSVVWGNMAVLKLPLELAVPAKIRGRAKRASEFGRALRRPHRITTDQRVFQSMRQGVQGTVLIDVSGSMRMTSDDIIELCRLMPASTIAVYSGPWLSVDKRYTHLSSGGSTDGWGSSRDGTVTVDGALRIIAHNNRMVDLKSSGHKADQIPKHLGGGHVTGGNVVDGPALAWLARQKGPRFWVCDGVVTGVTLDERSTPERRLVQGVDSFSAHLVREAANFSIQHRILRLDNISQVIEVAKRHRREHA